MKITITQEFDTAEEAVAFIGRAAGATVLDPARDAEPIEPNLPGVVLPSQTSGPNPIMKPPRRPRADAGRPRGAYKPRETARSAEGAEHTNAKPEGANAPSGAPGAATSGTAPAENVTTPAAAPSGAASTAPAASAAPAALTIDDLRATMKRLNDTPGKGTDACIQALREFGALRISAVPPEKFAEFHEHLLAQFPKAK